MRKTSAPPTDIVEFLQWFRLEMEMAWSQLQDITSREIKNRDVGGVAFRAGTKWKPGLTDEEIDEIEANWKIRFPPDHRHFLSVLNAPDRACISWGYTEPGTGVKSTLEQGPDCAVFCDWYGDPADIEARLQEPLEGLLFDIEYNSLWRPAWGKEPESLDEKKHQATSIVRNSPQLLPIYSHRYSAEFPEMPGTPILSVHQSDVIVYGVDMRQYLLAEFGDFMNIDPDDAIELQLAAASNFAVGSIPFWGDLVMSGTEAV
ncbi:MAG: SMI1/KNR4 family protein [Pseudomonadota bacterium]